MVIEPPCTGALGSRVSPSVNLTRSIGRPRVSAATCVIDVQVPGPMSLEALITSAVPSGKRRAMAEAGGGENGEGRPPPPPPDHPRPPRLQRRPGVPPAPPKRPAAARV